MEEEEDKQKEQTQSFLELCLEEDQEVATVGGREDKLLVRISQVQGSLDWRTFLVEEVATAVTVGTTTPHPTHVSADMTSLSRTSMETLMELAGGNLGDD